jgi:hypothetical protein
MRISNFIGIVQSNEKNDIVTRIINKYLKNIKVPNYIFTTEYPQLII